MMRAIGGFLRGSHAPIQVFLAALLGSLLGFAPGFGTAPALLVMLIALLLVLNANLGIALLVFGFAKLLSLLAMPLSFAIGEWILDGPLRGFMELLVNAPVLALCGLDHYAVTGGLVLGLVFGAVMGRFLIAALRGFRARMAKLEENSERYRKVTSAPGMRFVLWLLVGKGHGKQTYNELLSRKQRRPVRVVGLVLAALLVGAVLFVPGLMGGVITELSRTRLAQWNGATVDLEGVELDVAGNRMVITGLAMADPAALGTNLFEAARLEADLSSSDLLRGRLAIDRISVIDGAQGLARAVRGEIVGPPPRPSPPPEDAGEGRSLEDVLAQAQEWRERLATVREWLERFAPAPEEGEAQETLEERLEREVREQGWLGVVSHGLVRDAPTLLIREVIAGGVRSAQFADETLDVRLDNLSTDPGLLKDPARLRITSSGGSLEVDVALGGLSAGPSGNRLLFARTGLPTDSVAGDLVIDGKPVLSGGRLDLRLDGTWAGGDVGRVDLPLIVAFHQVQLRVGSQSQVVDNVSLPISLRGPIDAPRVSVDDDAVVQLFTGAVKAELQGRLDEERAELEQKVDEKKAEAKDKLKEKLGDKVGDELGGLFGGDDDEKDKKKSKKKKADQPPGEDG